MTDKKLGDIIGKYYPTEPTPTPNLDTSTEEGRAWKLHKLNQERANRFANANRDPWFDNR